MVTEYIDNKSTDDIYHTVALFFKVSKDFENDIEISFTTWRQYLIAHKNCNKSNYSYFFSHIKSTKSCL